MSAFSDKLRQIFVNIHNRFVDVDNKIEDIKNSSANGLSTELKTRYDTATLQAMYNEVIEPSPEEWFTFDSETQTITGLNEEYEEEYSSADVTKLVVPYSIDGMMVKKIGAYAFFPMTGDAWTTTIPSAVNDVRLPNCIDSIGDGAFSNAPIKSVNIPTSCYMIGSYAFEFCRYLHEVVTPIKPNWELKIGREAFHNCQSLKNIDTIIDGTKEIPDVAFSYTDIENVIIPESVDAIGYSAFKLSSLRNITFLNKNCILDDNWCDTEYLKLIKGYKGSTAETYAKNKGIPFMSIEGTEVFDKADKSDTYTKTEIDDKIANSSGSITVDQTYDAESENAQSGVAVAEAFIAHEEAVGEYTSAMRDTTSAPLDDYFLELFDTSAMGMLHSAFIDVHNHLVGLKRGKADKTVIKPDDETENVVFDFSDMCNSEKRLHTVSAVSIKFVDDEYAPDYISGLSFDSGETPTGFDYTDSGIINWVGTDCAKEGDISIFQPSPNTHYDIVFYFNGVQFIGLVNGFVPAEGNANGNEAV